MFEDNVKINIYGIDGKYTIDKNGNVYNYTTKKILKQYENKKGYLITSLFVEGKSLNLSVHRLVLGTFNYINNFSDFQVNHIDGIKTNNSLNNLEWVTNRENMMHSIEIGLRDHLNYNGENNPSNKYPESLILEIIDELQISYNIVSISKKYNVSESLIDAIRSGKKWKQLTNNVVFAKGICPKIHLKEDQVVEILNLIKDDFSNREISDIYNVSTKKIASIRLNKTFKHIQRF